MRLNLEAQGRQGRASSQFAAMPVPSWQATRVSVLLARQQGLHPRALSVSLTTRHPLMCSCQSAMYTAALPRPRQMAVIPRCHIPFPMYPPPVHLTGTLLLAVRL